MWRMEERRNRGFSDKAHHPSTHPFSGAAKWHFAQELRFNFSH
jgi:hypothetical protein